MQTGRSATKLLSSTLVTRTAVVAPLLGNVAAVVAPTARSAIVRFFPATCRACAFAGAATAVAEGEGLAVGDATGEGLVEGVALGDAVAFGDADGEAAGLVGTFLAGAFFTGFFAVFFTGFFEGFLAASARSPTTRAEITPAINAMNLRRPELL